jgi:hypothetical protein
VKYIFVILFCSIVAVAQNNLRIEIIQGTLNEDGWPTSPASVCLKSLHDKECYIPPEHNPPFGLNPKAKEINLNSDVDAVLFTVESSAGGSGSTTAISILKESKGKLIDLLPELSVSNQSEYGLWNESSISNMTILVTADFVWVGNEVHFASHRYRISSYIYDPQKQKYELTDQYVTEKKYSGLDKSEIITVLEPEKSTILRRLKKKLTGNN